MARANRTINRNNPPNKPKKKRVRSNARYFIKGVNVKTGKEVLLTEAHSMPVALAAYKMAKSMSEGVMRDLVILKTMEVTPDRQPASDSEQS